MQRFTRKGYSKGYGKKSYTLSLEPLSKRFVAYNSV